MSLKRDVSARCLATGDRSCIALDVNRSANAFLFAQTDLYSPPRLCSGMLASASGERQILSFNDDVLARWPKPTVMALDFKSADGVPIEAWFMAPSGARRPIPTILSIHNGPFAAAGHAYRYDFHMLVASGFGVLFANFRGSAGCGESFVRAIMGDWGARAFPDHMGAVDVAIASGLADENSDYFPEAMERTRAMSTYWMGGPLATIISFVVGGWLNELYGWRMTFLLMGIPGLLLAGLVALTVREPRKNSPQIVSCAHAPAMRAVFTFLWEQRSLRNISRSSCCTRWDPGWLPGMRQ